MEWNENIIMNLIFLPLNKTHWRWHGHNWPTYWSTYMRHSYHVRKSVLFLKRLWKYMRTVEAVPVLSATLSSLHQSRLLTVWECQSPSLITQHVASVSLLIHYSLSSVWSDNETAGYCHCLSFSMSHTPTHTPTYLPPGASWGSVSCPKTLACRL